MTAKVRHLSLSSPAHQTTAIGPTCLFTSPSASSKIPLKYGLIAGELRRIHVARFSHRRESVLVEGNSVPAASELLHAVYKFHCTEIEPHPSVLGAVGDRRLSVFSA